MKVTVEQIVIGPKKYSVRAWDNSRNYQDFVVLGGGNTREEAVTKAKEAVVDLLKQLEES